MQLSPTQNRIFQLISVEKGTVFFDSGWKILDKNNKPVPEIIKASSVRALCNVGLARTRKRRPDGKLELIIEQNPQIKLKKTYKGMANVYDEKQQSYRVNFACLTMLNYAKSRQCSSPNPSRKFDTCFEMGEADANMVAAKVYRRALKNPLLMEVLPKFINVEMAKRNYEDFLDSEEFVIEFSSSQTGETV